MWCNTPFKIDISHLLCCPASSWHFNKNWQHIREDVFRDVSKYKQVNKKTGSKRTRCLSYRPPPLRCPSDVLLLSQNRDPELLYSIDSSSPERLPVWNGHELSLLPCPIQFMHVKEKIFKKWYHCLTFFKTIVLQRSTLEQEYEARRPTWGRKNDQIFCVRIEYGSTRFGLLVRQELTFKSLPKVDNTYETTGI